MYFVIGLDYIGLYFSQHDWNANLMLMIRPSWCFCERAFAWHAGVHDSIPGRDRAKSLKQVVTAPLQHTPTRFKCYGSSDMTFVKSWSVSKQVLHVKEPSLLNSHECRVQVGKIFRPLPVMVTSIMIWTKEPKQTFLCDYINVLILCYY